MMNWKVVGLYLALLFLLVTAGKPLWWLPLGSLVLLFLTFPLKRPASDFDWQLWHPVFATLFASPANATLSRWVRYKKVVGGDSLIPFVAHGGSGILLFRLEQKRLRNLSALCLDEKPNRQCVGSTKAPFAEASGSYSKL